MEPVIFLPSFLSSFVLFIFIFFVCSFFLLPFFSRFALSLTLSVTLPVLRKKQNPGSPDGPPMIDGWVVRLWVVRQWYTETMKSIKELANISQSVLPLYSDTGTNRHTNGFVQDCSISSALAMEILQSCAKPWIWYQCICGVVRPLFLRNISCKT